MPMILGFMSEKMLLSDAGIQTTQVLMMLTKSVAYAGFYCGGGGQKAGVGILGKGQPALSPPPRRTGERCKLSQRDPARAPAAKRFCLYLNSPDSFSCNSIWVDTLLICVTKVPAKHT